MARKHRRYWPSNRARRNGIWFRRFGPVEYVQCCWCMVPMTFDEATLEHIVPLAEGGSNEDYNLDLACFDCNQERGLRTQQKLLERKLAEAMHPPEESGWWLSKRVRLIPKPRQKAHHRAHEEAHDL